MASKIPPTLILQHPETIDMTHFTRNGVSGTSPERAAIYDAEPI